jgi:hypothetical protein
LNIPDFNDKPFFDPFIANEIITESNLLEKKSIDEASLHCHADYDQEKQIKTA